MSFFKNGYEIFENFIDPNKLDIFSDSLFNKEVVCYANQNFFKLKDPYVQCPEIIDLCLTTEVQKLVRLLLGNHWAIGGCNLRRNLVTNNAENTVTFFHRDHNSNNFIKLFFYLNDVTMEGGPFTYVEGSHIDRRESGWTDGSRWTDEQITGLYGQDKIKHLTANKGDLIVANTTGFHKGLKCKVKERLMLTINFTTEQERYGKFKLKKNTLDRLSEDDKFRCRFLEIV